MLIDGRNTDKFLNDTFTAGVDNFNRRISEFESNLSYKYLAELYDAFFNPQYWRSKPSDLQAYLMTYVHSIKYDYAKALQHLLQGYLSDHYFFVRRAVESVQLVLFLKEKITSDQIFREYSEISTNDFKNKYKYKKWFAQKKEHFQKNYSISMKAYDDACSFGVHVSKDRRQLFQTMDFKSSGELLITSVFHDCISPSHPFDMVPVYYLKIHEIFCDIYRTLVHEKVFEVVLPKDKVSKFQNRFLENAKFLKEHYKNIDPESKHVSFDF